MTVVINGTTGITNPNSMTIGNGGGSVASNTAVGANALAANTTGADNTALGYGSLKTNTTSNYSTAVGRDALTLATGARNTAVGAYSQNNTSTGASNSSLGTGALNATTTGSYNTAVGDAALLSNTVSGYTVAIGYQAGYSYNRTADANNGYNTFVGPFAGYYNTTGRANTIIGGYNGNQGGLDIRTLSNYIVLSDGDGNPRLYVNDNGTVLSGIGGDIASSTNYKVFSSTFYSTTAGVPNFVGNWTASGNWGIGSHTNTSSTYIRIGGVGTYAWNGVYAAIYAGAYTNASDYRIKENVVDYAQSGLEQVMALRPVSYKIKDVEATNSDGSVETNVGEQTIGFIAHEVQAIIPELVSGTKDEVDSYGTEIHQGLDYAKMVTVLVKAIQELNAKVEAQAAEIAALKGQA